MSYYGKHASMSEWVKAAKLSWANDLIREDATKRDRLRTLARVADLPITPSASFTYDQIFANADEFAYFRDQVAGDVGYALRLNPTDVGRKVIRNRNLPVADLISWAMSLDADLRSYSFTFEPHVVSVQAAILVVSEDGVSGEAANASILDLNSGTNPDTTSYVFTQNDSLQVEIGCPADLKAFLERVLVSMAVSSSAARAELEDLLGLQFNSDRARGYYEAIADIDGNVWFIDYNRVLETPLSFMVRSAPPKFDGGVRTLSGHTGCAGYASGRARLIDLYSPIDPENIASGDVVVCRLTEPKHLEMFSRAAAVITDLGGVLSHAAIVSRELGKPCVVGTRTATSEIREGDFVEVRATEGIVTVRPESTGGRGAARG